MPDRALFSHCVEGTTRAEALPAEREASAPAIRMLEVQLTSCVALARGLACYSLQSDGNDQSNPIRGAGLGSRSRLHIVVGAGRGVGLSQGHCARRFGTVQEARWPTKLALVCHGPSPESSMFSSATQAPRGLRAFRVGSRRRSSRRAARRKHRRHMAQAAHRLPLRLV